jgi:hypothetical protein
MKPSSHRSFSTFIAVFFFSIGSAYSQVVPVSFDQRVANSSVIAIVRLKDQQCYWDGKRANIYTRNVLEVKAFLKGASTENTLVAISPGGIVGNQAEFVCPAETYQPNTDYLVLLKEDDSNVDDKSYRQARPGIRQCLSYAGIQSLLPYQDGVYKDAMAEAPMTEQELLNRMRTSYRLEAKTPAGTNYIARIQSPPSSQRLLSVTTITDGTGSFPATGFVSSTMPANNELIINGSGFGATAGSVQFANGNDGGATNISTVTSDIVSWSDAQIRVKIPDLAGTGTLTVRDAGSVNVGTSPITIKWGEINVTSAFSGHATDQRQQVKLLNRNGAGGYTFQYSSNTANGPAFSADASAIASFQRALRSMRCATLVNFNVQGNSSNAAGFANDDVNIIMYDNVSLPAGALGVCTSRFSASSTGSCNLFNTVWYLDEMDIRVLTVPVAGFTWNFSTSAPTGSQFDFETVMLHEIGHGHGLRHIILPSSTMHYSVSNGSAKRALSANEIQGGQHRISVSNSNCLNTNGVGGFTPHAAVSPAVCSVLLPVSLLDFSGQRQAGSINLEWTTEWESNLRGFHIERSTDGQNFSPIKFVPAAGNAAGRYTYMQPDNTLFPVIVYYRLRMEDNDNDYKYSKIISFNPDNKGWKLFPNPAGDNVYIVPDNGYGQKNSLEVSDLSGRTVLSYELTQVNQGVAIPISVKKLIPGIYIVKIVSGDKTLLAEKLYKK